VTRTMVRDGVALAVDDQDGNGLPVVFQHGLCGDRRQVAEIFPDDPRFRRLTLECRGHGLSEAGDPAAFSIATFADDVAAMIEERLGGPVILGGISMGAAIGLRLAVKRPDLARGLILARPAWLTERAPANMAPNGEVGQLIATLPSPRAAETFRASPTALRLAVEAPDNLASLEGFFSREPARITAALLQAIAADGPGIEEAELGAIRVPTLVIGHRRDVVHPLGFAEVLAARIPGAGLAVITPKADDRARYVGDFREAMATFLAALA
jgi:pimeloyl-ACP methyl ester carboxylesterase